VAFGGLAISGSSPAGAVPVELDSSQRLAGDDRYETSSVIAEELEDQMGTTDIETVIVANGENFPDALAASALAGTSAPILLVKSDSIPSSVLQRMGRLSSTVEDVFVVGGTSAISEAVFAQIEGVFDDADVERLSGDDRYATALAIADEVGNDTGTVMIASGTGFADAVSIGSYAAAEGFPVLLAGASGLDADTIAWIETAVDDEDLARAIIIGGPAAVAAGVEDQLAEAGVPTAGISRVAGPDRYLTNLLWNLEEFGAATTKQLGADSPSKAGESVMLVTGTNFADALAAAPLAARLNAHVVLTNPVGGGAGWLTLAGTLPTALTVDTLAASFVSAGFSDGAMTGGTSYGTADLWVIGGTSAVPAAVVAAGETASAGSAVTCSVTVGGSNGTGGPSTATIAFNKNLSNALVANGIIDLGSSALGLDLVYDETNLVTDDDNRSALYDVDGATVTNETLLDLDEDGFSDAVRLTFSAALDIDDVVEFRGFDQDAGDYGDAVAGQTPSDANLITYVGANVVGTAAEEAAILAAAAAFVDGDSINGTSLRDFDDCSATVEEDDSEPEVTIYPMLGDLGEVSDHVLYIEFSEKLDPNLTADQYAAQLVSDVTLSAQLENLPDADGDVDCTMNSSLTAATCILDGVSISATSEVTLSAETYYDDAGNELDNAGTPVVGDESVLADYDTDYNDAPGISADATCAKLGTGGNKSGAWADYGVSGSSAAGSIDIPLASGNLSLAAKSGHAGLDANEWNFTVTHERGLVRPTIVVDGKDVTITVDRFFHDGNDIARVINDHPVVGRGGLAPLWEATGAAQLVAVTSIDEAFNTDNAGTEATQTCYVEITLDGPMSATLSGSGPTLSAGTPDAAGEIRIQIGGQDQYAAASYVSSVGYAWGGPRDAGSTLYVAVNGTTSTGTVRVSMMTTGLDGSETSVKTVTAS
jgi:putative cell wall-binding protein